MLTNCTTNEQIIIICTVEDMLTEKKKLKEKLLNCDTSLKDFLQLISKYQILDSTLKREDSI